MADLDAIYLAAYAVGQFTWGVLADASARASWCSAAC